MVEEIVKLAKRVLMNFWIEPAIKREFARVCKLQGTNTSSKLRLLMLQEISKSRVSLVMNGTNNLLK